MKEMNYKIDKLKELILQNKSNTPDKFSQVY